MIHRLALQFHFATSLVPEPTSWLQHPHSVAVSFPSGTSVRTGVNDRQDAARSDSLNGGLGEGWDVCLTQLAA
jgi:hypothetical protein